MKKFYKVLSGVLAGVMLMASAPMTAKAAPSVSSETTYYLGSTTTNGSASIYIGNLAKNSKITDVKSSKNSVLEYYYTVKYKNSSSSSSTYSGNAPYQNSSSSETNYYAYIYFKYKKTGTAALSYKIDKKKYTTKVNIKPYTCQVDTFTLSGINGGKNLASVYKKSSSNAFKPAGKDVKNAKLNFKPKKGCVVTYAYFYNYTTGCSVSRGFGSAGAKSVSLDIGTIPKNTSSAYGYVTVYDKKAGYSRSYYIHLYR